MEKVEYLVNFSLQTLACGFAYYILHIWREIMSAIITRNVFYNIRVQVYYLYNNKSWQYSLLDWNKIVLISFLCKISTSLDRHQTVVA